MRLHEIHPAAVHMPIVLAPLAVGADYMAATGRAPALGRWGQRLTFAAAGGALMSAVTGLVAQPAVEAEGRAHHLLVTHRNMNLASTIALGFLAAVRARRSGPGVETLLAGAAIVGAVTYSAYLGGKMVYQEGIGTAGGSGLKEEASPSLREPMKALRTALRNLKEGTAHALHHLKEGEVLPALRVRRRENREIARRP